MISDNWDLTQEYKVLVKDTWAENLKLGKETVGKLLMKKIFNIDPEIQKYFSFRDIPLDDLFESNELK